ncbi:MAG: AAA family ATPase [Actinobacteria bacterium]|nr:AAA family ATPase [Actinomycetota bacterium]
MTSHPDVPAEQAHIDHAYRCLEAMRERARYLLESNLEGSSIDQQALRWELRARLASLDESRSPLTFGRIDHDAGPTYYVGRRHVRGEDEGEVVIDWRAPAATPFYRATIQDPLDLIRRRRFVIEGRSLVDLFDENFDDPDQAIGGHGGVPDPLLAELGRARTGQMRDIVATIQAEQDEIIRCPLDSVIVVQGGPGTGKTAVGLHRAAFLLYEYREVLQRDPVLIVGPNRLFLEYISHVLPSLGETAAYQTTVETLAALEFRGRRSDPPDVARIKGDERMAEILRRACWGYVSPASEPIEARIAGIRVLISPAEIDHAVAGAMEGAGPRAPYRIARDTFLERLGNTWLKRHEAEAYSAGHDALGFIATLSKSPAVKRVLNSVWPSNGPAALVRDLLTSGARAEAAAAELMTPAEVSLLRTRARVLKDEGWSHSDVALLDEADWLINGSRRRFGHAIVDEAQDLSAMQFRMIARRTREGSMTVLGDLAQATSPSSQSNWSDVLRHLGHGPDGEIKELSIGYRVPLGLLRFANQLLPVAAPGVLAATSVRETNDPPKFKRVTADEMVTELVAEIRALEELWTSVGVICPEAVVSGMRDLLVKEDLRIAYWAEGLLDESITLLTAAAAKGLEFDAVIVVEPGVIYRESNGPRRLYVALTRAVQHLSMLYTEDLPDPLRHSGG